ncbi:RusA family crossover junction endodeoxyribonuclease [uncultured Allobaculum sp.]|uniref:RusA family crossover junction endodeoxyribonuclease n=1 Tax=uncultured Allobaculum sp. TaxID=1187017 RepID=UPI00258F2F05|nr:RusA family crossover junction endodeoxyribonuclease [uncultured Allobaculum sp.]
MSEKTVIWIPGEPARVTHQSGTRHLRTGRSYKTKALKDWEATLKAALLPYRLEKPLEGPVSLTVTFGYQAKKKSNLWKWKTTRPDTDNMIKTVKDVMTRMGFWKDDAQIVVERCSKFWSKDPGIGIVVEPLEEDNGELIDDEEVER